MGSRGRQRMNYPLNPRVECPAHPASKELRCLPFQSSLFQTTQRACFTTGHSPSWGNSSPSCSEDHTTGTHRRRSPCRSPCCCDRTMAGHYWNIKKNKWGVVTDTVVKRSSSPSFVKNLVLFRDLLTGCFLQDPPASNVSTEKNKNWLKT